ncbi:MAG: CHASE3 domain-containing protein, partial [Chitinophagaceae bacterium]|nr:CHASE3 domain-containing protein [Chitinophagaceae bacterium]
MPATFKRNILIGFGLSMFLLVVSSAASFISIRSLLSSAKWVDHTNQVIVELETINTQLLEIETNQRGYLLSDDERFLSPVQVNLIDIRNQLNKIKALTNDNIVQQDNANHLTRTIESRLDILNALIAAKKQGKPITPERIIKGKELMDDARLVVERMEEEERKLLIKRTQDLKKFSDFTPALIVIAALISLISTLVFYGRIISDFRQRLRLQDELQRKDLEISRRLNIIQSIAEKVSQGNYSIRVDDESRDVLGSLSGSLNKMSESLAYSFKSLADKEWLQAGVAGLSQQMVGEQDIEELCASVLNFATEYSGSSVGALYLYDEVRNDLVLKSSYSISAEQGKRIRVGDGIVGQSAQQKKILTVDGLSEKNFNLVSTAGNVVPASIIAI